MHGRVKMGIVPNKSHQSALAHHCDKVDDQGHKDEEDLQPWSLYSSVINLKSLTPTVPELTTFQNTSDVDIREVKVRLKRQDSSARQCSVFKDFAVTFYLRHYWEDERLFFPSTPNKSMTFDHRLMKRILVLLPFSPSKRSFICDTTVENIVQQVHLDSTSSSVSVMLEIGIQAEDVILSWF
ncbi:Gamma-Aminobutyric Acid Receptor Subunit Rho-3 [Manis pentadactyla]|nr:Gamma-Aminobutyric Acid Receptor Subunit Rho-3 [Manis pentadactyla]